MKWIVAVSAVLAVCAFSVIKSSGSAEAARRERGRYLVEGPAHCFMCHSELDWSPAGCPPKPEAKGGGQNPFCEETLPWLVAPNISPDPETGAGRFPTGGESRW